MLAIIPLQRAGLGKARWLDTLTDPRLAQLQKGIARFAARRPISAALIGLGAFMIYRMIGGRR